MVRKYIRKTERKSWSENAMRAAIEAVINAGYSINRASADFKVPQATLSRKITQCRKNPVLKEELLANPKGVSAQRVFTPEQEALLCKYIKILQNQLVDLNSLDIRRLAYSFAERFSIPHRFKKDTEVAGDDWYRAFVKRNPCISVKKSVSEKTDSISDNKIAKNEKVNKFFDNLKNVFTAHQLEASKIYSIDEAIVTCSLSADSNSANSLNNQKLVTAVICFSANGTFVPLTLVLPSREICDYPQNEATNSEIWTSFSATGQMELEIFVKWLKKFIEFSKASRNSPVLLLVDGYRSYLKNLNVLEIVENNGVEILCLPFNCSSKLQPIQHNFMKILSKTYESEIKLWTNTNPAQSITVHKVYYLFKYIFEKLSLMQNIPVDSFQDTGILPLNKDLFQEFILEKDDKCNEMEFEYNENNSPHLLESYIAAAPEVLYDADKTTFDNEKTVQENGIEETFTSENEANRSFNEDNMCPVPIPSEAKLTAVSIEDLYSLMHTKEKLYFYVSPFKLNLPS